MQKDITLYLQGKMQYHVIADLINEGYDNIYMIDENDKNEENENLEAVLVTDCYLQENTKLQDFVYQVVAIFWDLDAVMQLIDRINTRKENQDSAWIIQLEKQEICDEIRPVVRKIGFNEFTVTIIEKKDNNRRAFIKRKLLTGHDMIEIAAEILRNNRRADESFENILYTIKQVQKEIN